MHEISGEELLKNVRYNDAGLVPVIAQQFDTGEVLMMAWANETALRETIRTKRMCYFSRSRQSLWRKGETSGHVQRATGSACHTGNRSCFFRKTTDFAPDAGQKG